MDTIEVHLLGYSSVIVRKLMLLFFDTYIFCQFKNISGMIAREGEFEGLDQILPH